MLPDRPPEVTFSCDKDTDMCHFQFWTAQVESFYCQLSQCESKVSHDFNKNTTLYNCEHIDCKCVPGRFICGEDGSLGMYHLNILGAIIANTWARYHRLLEGIHHGSCVIYLRFW